MGPRETNEKTVALDGTGTWPAKALAYIEANIRRPITVGEIAHHMGSSVSQVSRRFRASTGRSPMQMVILVRMRHAAALLERTDLPCKEIAGLVGIIWLGSFGRLFRTAHGISPAKYRRLRLKSHVDVAVAGRDRSVSATLEVPGSSAENGKNCEVIGRNCEVIEVDSSRPRNDTNYVKAEC